MGAAAAEIEGADLAISILPGSVGKPVNDWNDGYLVCSSCVLGK